MRALETLQAGLEDFYTGIHSRRVTALWRGVEGVLRGGKLWLTGLGRHLPGEAIDKHKIKAADRLLGNRHLQAEQSQLYEGLAHWLLRGKKRVVLIVDTMIVGQFAVHTTAAAFCGRSVPIFSRVYKNGGASLSKREQRQYVMSLAKVIPEWCTPIVVTDAGYYSVWFEAILDQGWDFVGRVRNRPSVFLDGQWQPAKRLHKRVAKHAKSLGTLLIYRNKPREYRLILSAEPTSKGRQRLTKKKRERGNRTLDQRHSKGAKEPWLLATSLTSSPKEVVSIYATRMQIEESFRDLKNSRHGWEFALQGCRKPERLEVLLLCAALANVVLLLVGLQAENAGHHRHFQANTVRNRRVLSHFVLGRLILERGYPTSPPRAAVTRLRRAIHTGG